MITLTLACDSAAIKNVNIRLEMHGKEEKELGTDIDISAAVDVDFLDKLAIGEEMDYRAFLFTEKGEVRASGIKALAFDRQYEEHNVDILIPTLHEDKVCELKNVKIKKLSASPDFGFRMNLNLQVQCHPTDEQREFLLDAWRRGDIMLRIMEPAQGDLVNTLDEEAEKEEAEPGEAA